MILILKLGFAFKQIVCDFLNTKINGLIEWLHQCNYNRLFKSFGKNVVIKRPIISISNHSFISIGDNVYIHKNARIEAFTDYLGQTLCPELIIEDDVIINQNFHCTCGKRIVIGSGSSITANCGIFDIEHPYDDISTPPIYRLLNVLMY